MTWTTITTFVTGQLITADIMNNQIAGNIAHLASLEVNGTALSALAAGSTLTEDVVTTKGDIFIHNGAAEARMPVGSDGQTLVADSGEAAGLAWGDFSASVKYTGDGNATRTITGLGFQPAVVLVFSNSSISRMWKSSIDGTKSFSPGGLVSGYLDDNIISLDADGITVGDNSSGSNYININATVYTVIAWR